MLHKVFICAEELNVAELIYLVITDSLNCHHRFEVLDVLFRWRYHCNACTRECYLWSGGKHINSVRVACLFALVKNVEKFVRRIRKVVDTICVIPEYLEILSLCLHGCKTFYYFVRVCCACRVSIHWNTPYTLYSIVFGNELFYHIHVRTVFVHWNVYKLKAHFFCYKKMSVISRNRAEPLDFCVLPRLLTIACAKKHELCDSIIHDVKAWVSANDKLIRCYAEHRSKKCLSLRQTVKTAVVSTICAVLSETILAALYCCEQTLCQVELFGRRLSSCHVQRKSLSLEIVIFFLDFCFEWCQFLCRHFC